MKIPEKFLFRIKDYTDIYRAERIGGNYYSGTEHEAITVYHTQWDEDEVEEYFKRGIWQEVSMAEPQERDLVFPFTYHHAGHTNEYTVFKSLGGILHWYKGGKHFDSELFTEAELRDEIKSGSMIVKRVGEQLKEESLKVGSLNSLSANSLTINVDTQPLQDALSITRDLADALEEVNIALESFQAILADMGLAVVSKGVADDCHAFCCGD